MSFVPDAQAPLKRIALLDTPEQRYLVMDTGGSALAVFGLAGGIAKSAHMTSTIDKLNQSFEKQQLAFGSAVTNALEAALREKGFEVIRMPGVQPTPGTKDTPIGYGHIKSDADGILNVRLAMVGFMSRVNITTEYLPLAMVVARLRSPDGSRDLMLSFLSYCSDFPKDPNVRKLPCLPQVQPITSDEVLTSADSPAGANLLSGAALIASTIASQLQPEPMAAKP